jgi:gas vesicle protein
MMQNLNSTICGALCATLLLASTVACDDTEEALKVRSAEEAKQAKQATSDAKDEVKAATSEAIDEAKEAASQVGEEAKSAADKAKEKIDEVDGAVADEIRDEK